MGTRDPRVDAYIERSPDFAKPILTHLREVVHAACPEVEETMKWSFPHFTYHGILASMASFRQHCSFGLWRGSPRVDDADRRARAMGDFGRITTRKDLPPKRELTALVRKAMKLNEEGVRAPAKRKPAQAPLAVPPDLAAALRKDRKAKATFDAFSPSNRRDYIEWLEEPKTDATRRKRLATTLEWLAEGKPRNWMYMK
jgi:uncharacterized protein YdeI (YjbR/CyaY-like superfamily)